LLVASLSRAQCSKDTDCKGERICEAGACVAASAALPPPPAAPAAVPPTTEPAPAPPPAASQDRVVAPRPLEPPPAVMAPAKPKMQRHSTGMMVGGIVMTSLAPFALIVSLVADLEQNSCEGGFFGEPTLDSNGRYRDCSSYDRAIYGGLLVGGGLLAAGIPMIVIGAKKEPVATATVRGWIGNGGGGLGLRVDL
jgi:hypothetical protein